MKRVTVGSFERISLPDLGLIDVIAKVDTGAYSGAVHCTNMRLVRRGLRRKQVLKFTPAGRPELATETDTFVKKKVRSSTGHSVTRYLVRTRLVIQGKTYMVEIGLSDRSDMKKQVLIGRRFLREADMMVDVRVNADYDDEGESTQ